jgi:hypothetical protein
VCRLLGLLLPWVIVFDMCNFGDSGLIEQFVQGDESATGRHHRANFDFERVAKDCPGNGVEDFFMRL